MNAWFFDIDGVITDPKHKTVEKKVLDHILKILKQGNFVAFNTGRSFSWTEEKILTQLLKAEQDKSIFTNMFVVCEKGNVLGSWANDAWNKRLLDDPLPKKLHEQMKVLASEFADSVFFDDSKETMITFEMHEGFDVQKFGKIIEELEQKVKNIVQSPEFADMELRIDPSYIDLDIQYEDAGKHLGAERIEDFMLEHGIKPNIIYMLGDSPSDSEMAEELQGAYPIQFVYVGDEAKLNRDKLTCDVVVTTSKYTAGALEFLEKKT